MAELTTRFEGALDSIEAGAREGVEDALEFLLKQANKKVPLEEGTLMRSGDYRIVEINDGIAGEVYYSSVYAMRQHEELTWRHDDGREAKWLEKAAIKNATKIGTIIGKPIQTRLT